MTGSSGNVFGDLHTGMNRLVDINITVIDRTVLKYFGMVVYFGFE